MLGSPSSLPHSLPTRKPVDQKLRSKGPQKHISFLPHSVLLYLSLTKKQTQMDSRKVAALLSSIVSQILLLLLHLLLSPPPSTSPSSLSPLLLHFLSSTEISSLISSSSRKRKRTQNPESESETTQNPESEFDDDDEDEEIKGKKSWVSSRNRKRTQNPESESETTQNPESEFDDDDDDEDEEIKGKKSWVSSLPHIDSYKVFFRMNSTTFEWLSGLLEPLLECRDPIDSPPLNLSPEIRLGIGLFRLATGSDYKEISTRFGVSESISRFCTKQLCRVLCTNFRFWVAFPGSDHELDSVSTGFESNGLPNCCGIVACTRFKIIVNNGGKFSQEETIAAQIVVDSSMRILSIVAGFRGDKGDYRVLKSSTLFKDVEGGNLLNGGHLSNLSGVNVPQYLIGDNGYPLLPWLMVPFVEPSPSFCEEAFNETHKRMRLPALRTIVSLRNWGVLNQPIKEEFKTAVAIIGACSILHNALLMREDYSAVSDEMEDYSLYDQSSQYYGDNSVEENPITIKALGIRSALAAKAREVLDSNR